MNINFEKLVNKPQELSKYTLNGDVFDEDHPKYVLIDSRNNTLDKQWYRILYKDGTLGGRLEGYWNLNQSGNCKVLDDARIYDTSCVRGNAIIKNSAYVSGNSYVIGDAVISGRANINKSKISGEVHITDNADIYRSIVYGKAFIHEDAKLWYSWAYDEAEICLFAKVTDFSRIFGKSKITHDIYGGSYIEDNKLVKKVDTLKLLDELFPVKKYYR